jgi:hypothetical protein
MEFERRNPESPPPPEGVESLLSQGITAIALDALPGSTLSEGKVNRYRLHLTRHLGPPVDYGAVIVWWLAEPSVEFEMEGLFELRGVQYPDGDSWREAVRRSIANSPVIELDSLIQPTWGVKHDR